MRDSEIKSTDTKQSNATPWPQFWASEFLRNEEEDLNDAKKQNQKVWSRDAALAELRRILPELQSKYGVTRIGIFGSVARDEAKPGSDLDVMVDLRTPDYFMMAAILNYIEDLFQCKVDMIRWRENLGQVFRSELDKDLTWVTTTQDEMTSESRRALDNLPSFAAQRHVITCPTNTFKSQMQFILPCPGAPRP